jgi:hypothetical protein
MEGQILRATRLAKKIPFAGLQFASEGG